MSGGRTRALHFALVGTLVHFGAAGRHQTHSHARAKPKTALGSSALRYARTSPSPCGQAQSRPGDPPLPSLSTCGSFVRDLFPLFFVCALRAYRPWASCCCVPEKNLFHFFHCVIIALATRFSGCAPIFPHSRRPRSAARGEIFFTASQ